MTPALQGRARVGAKCVYLESRIGRGQPLSFTLSDCRLAKSRGLMRRVKYGAVNGWRGTHSLVIHTGHIVTKKRVL